MKSMDFIILGILLVWLVAVVCYLWKNKKQGKCVGCSGACTGCSECQSKQEK